MQSNAENKPKSVAKSVSQEPDKKGINGKINPSSSKDVRS